MIYVFLANGFEEIEALTPVDVLLRAGFEVKTVAVGDGKTVTGAHGISVIADIHESEYRDATPEAIILPGGMPGTTNLEKSATVINAINQAMNNGALVGAICAAPSILGIMGYLNQRNATCFPGFEQYLDGANVLDARVVVDGNVITSRGMGCASEFSLAIIEYLAGKERAGKIARAAFIK
ncbi:MAG: DJ-1/PfpI family protein [Clostridia bacterium]|nr:DJ-1/PfpI family protein [Clostridia bacterium]